MAAPVPFESQDPIPAQGEGGEHRGAVGGCAFCNVGAEGMVEKDGLEGPYQGAPVLVEGVAGWGGFGGSGRRSTVGGWGSAGP